MEQMYVNGQLVTVDPYKLAKRLDELENLLKYIIENGSDEVQSLIQGYYLSLSGKGVTLNNDELSLIGDNVEIQNDTLMI